jgi:hypothetical protein
LNDHVCPSSFNAWQSSEAQAKAPGYVTRSPVASSRRAPRSAAQGAPWSSGSRAAAAARSSRPALQSDSGCGRHRFSSGRLTALVDPEVVGDDLHVQEPRTSNARATTRVPAGICSIARGVRSTAALSAATCLVASHVAADRWRTARAIATGRRRSCRERCMTRARDWPRSRSRRRRVRYLAALFASRRATALRPELLAAGPASTNPTRFARLA